MCICILCSCASVCVDVSCSCIYIRARVCVPRMCVFYMPFGVFVRIFTCVCIRILCVMFSRVFLVVASSSLLLLWFYPQYWFIDLLIYCYTGVYWFIDLLIYCYIGLLLLVVSISYYWFSKTPKICRSLRFLLFTIQLWPFFLENAKFARF